MPRKAEGPRIRWDAAAGVWKIHYRDGGHSRRLSTRTDSRKAAEEIFRGWLAESQTIRRRGHRFTINQCLQIYWDEYAANSVAAPERVITSWNNIRAFLGDRLPAEIDQGLINDFIEFRTDMPNGRGGKVRPQTVRTELLAMMAAIRYVAKTRKLAPEDLPGYFVMPAAGPRCERFLTTKEIEQLVSAVRGKRRGGRLTRLERWLALALYTGARKTAIAHLEWSRVDFARGLINFEYDPSRKNRGKKLRPVVPIAADLMPVLTQAYAERKNELVLDRTTCIDRVLSTAARQAGLAGVTPHVIRHTWASHAAMQGVPLLDIARVLGNSVAMVETVYAKYAPEYLRSAVDGAYGDRPRQGQYGPNGADCRPVFAVVGVSSQHTNTMIGNGIPAKSDG